MTLIVDAAPLVAVGDRSDPRQEIVWRVVQEERGPLVIPAPVTAEVDYLLTRRGGPEPARAFIADIAAGLFRVECLEPGDYPLVLELMDRYRDLGPGLADISIVILARRFDTRRILTFDYRHFRTIRPLQGRTFELLPMV